MKSKINSMYKCEFIVNINIHLLTFYLLEGL